MGAHGAPRDYSTECDAMTPRHNDSGSQSMLRASTESLKLWFIFGKTHRATMDVSDTLPDDIDAFITRTVELSNQTFELRKVRAYNGLYLYDGR